MGERAQTERTARRLGELGAQVTVMPGGEWCRGELELPEGTLPGLPAETLVFATLGPHAIKCLSPEPLFLLPPISLGGVTHAAGLLARIRDAWRERQDDVAVEAATLRAGGGAPTLEHAGLCAAFPIDVEHPESAVRFVGLGRAVLPSRGLLGGHPMPKAELRVMPMPLSTDDSATDVEIALTGRLEALERDAARREQSARNRPAEPIALAPEGPGRGRTHRLRGDGLRLLLVGPTLQRDGELAQGLRDQGYRVTVCRAVDDALHAFAASSFDAVLADAELGRLEGLELVPAIAGLPGVATLPVVIVDDQARSARREAARRIGAAGYLARPIELTRISKGIARIASGARGRRYERLDERLAVRFRAWRDAAFTTQVGRLGCFVQTEHDARPGDVTPVEIIVPEWNETLRLDATVTHRIASAGAAAAGLGLRFRGFPDRNEPRWIDYLRDRCAS